MEAGGSNDGAGVFQVGGNAGQLGGGQGVCHLGNGLGAGGPVHHELAQQGVEEGRYLRPALYPRVHPHPCRTANKTYPVQATAVHITGHAWLYDRVCFSYQLADIKLWNIA